MIKISFTCAKCKYQTYFSDSEKVNEAAPTHIHIDFLNMKINAICPECGHENEMNLGNIESELKKKTRLPRMGGVRF